MIVLLFDTSKLDISDEYKQVIQCLRGNEEKVCRRILLFSLYLFSSAISTNYQRYKMLIRLECSLVLCLFMSKV